MAVGLIVRPWGARGELKVEPLTDFAGRFARGARLWVGGTARTVRRARRHKDALIVSLTGVDDAGDAEALRGLLLEVPEAELPALPPDTYYRYQLLGMEVRSTEGAIIGRVTDVMDTGSNEVFVVRSGAGEVLVPAIDDVVKEIDVAARRMTIAVIEGLLPEPRKRASKSSHGRAAPPASPGQP